MDLEKRTLASIAIVLAGVFLGVSAGILAESPSTDQASGTVIDFGEYDTVWTDADIGSFRTTLSLLEYAADSNGYELVLGEDGSILSLAGIQSGDGGSWGLWVVYPGETSWSRLQAPYDSDPSSYTITSWAYRSEGEEPTVAVDYSGNPIYGYAQKYRIVSLSPTITEIMVSVKAGNVLVGVDSYSYYPGSVMAGRENGSISVIGTYASPSFELILGTNPDVVFCDGSQRSHVQMGSQLRGANVDAVTVYPGEDTRSILNNIFIIGQVINYGLAADEVIVETNSILDILYEMTHSTSAGEPERTMIALDPDISPWVSGDGTYLANMLGMFNASNVFGDWTGWVHITSDRIPYANPDRIIVITQEYSATQEEYDALYWGLSAQWKDTDAWRNGDVYVICESAADLVQRFGPRTAQAAELLAMILHPDAFGKEVPKIIGDGYEELLEYSSDLSLT